MRRTGSEDGGRILFADDLDDDLACPGPGVALEQHDLLPLSECELAVGERYSEGWSHQRRSDVTGSVIVSPTFVMTVVCSLRRQFLQ